ncbi:MAG: nucleotide exchange factor GrpE [Bacteroidia bacterium]|nr:nucleotide exchange factor GrpE [Bacteroidia bacterium]
MNKDMQDNINDQELDNKETNIPIEEEQEKGSDPVEGEVDVKVDSSSKNKKGKEKDISSEDIPNLDAAMKAIAELKLELRETKKEMDEHKSTALRLQADFINFRKRKDKEMGDTVRFANEDLIKELLPVLDNFDRTLDAIEKTDNLAAIKEGITLVSNSMRRQLTKIGLEPIESKGKSFDVNLHDAITSIPVEEEEKKGVVVDEIEKGYKLKDKVIRFSKVVVGE